MILGVDRARILPARAEPNEFLKIRAKTEPRSASSASLCIAEQANLGSSRAELDFAEPITSRAKSEPGKTMARSTPNLMFENFICFALNKTNFRHKRLKI